MNLTTLLVSVLGLVVALSFTSPKFLMAETQIGIDLGTTFSVVAVCASGNTSVIPVDSARTVPSVIAVDPTGTLIVGSPAVELRTRSPLSTAFNVKRVIGRTADDPELEGEKLPFKLSSNSDSNGVLIELGGEQHRPEELSGAVLTKLKLAAEKAQGWRQRLGFRFTSVTVTVPVSFGPPQRAATRRAASLAGFKQVRLVEEPVAAAMSYGLHRSRARRNVLVYDLGGGTLDAALLSLEDGVFRVEHTEGDSHLGGNNFDLALADFLRSQLTNRTSCMGYPQTHEDEQRLVLAAERAKRQLSSSGGQSVLVQLGDDCSVPITNDEFEGHAKELFDRAILPVAEVLRVTHTKKEEIDEVVLVGGATRMPKIAEQIIEFFGRDLLHNTIDPDEAIAIGAASGFGC